MRKKKEQEIYFALQGNHSQEIYLWLKKKYSGISIKIFFDSPVSCRPGRVKANQHIFKFALRYFLSDRKFICFNGQYQ